MGARRERGRARGAPAGQKPGLPSPVHFHEPPEPGHQRLVSALVDEQPILCAFTLSELERLVAWGSWKQREIALEPEDGELLERIKRLVAAGEAPPRGGGEGSRFPSARPPGVAE
jgi:hypothetical protein